ncbi:alpha/beta hydrolase [Guyparkeria hydrothermalis]|uniref:esterase/lipase family protein n=1 Tax=Guyparkeria hydrothermalis TaxID=923 RepID=UPI002020DF01|nr:alpha/beta fold hydrolase [Guyparkeria hydrothermalis]MCL7745153.1 alpha/beta hydrolase [Guyparkeria hydrothermalis]
MTDTPRPTAVLIHGLWMGPWALRPLANRLNDAGLATARFGYSTRATPAASADRLADWLTGQAHMPRHLVAHSLGGIVLAHLFDRHPALLLPDTHVVLLGSPLAGSAVARRLASWSLARRLLAGSLIDGLDGRAPAWQAANTLMLAGTRPIGPGRLVPGALVGPNDGTVAVDETRVPGLAAHRCLPANHFGLLLSRPVAEAAAAFLLDR